MYAENNPNNLIDQLGFMACKPQNKITIDTSYECIRRYKTEKTRFNIKIGKWEYKYYWEYYEVKQEQMQRKCQECVNGEMVEHTETINIGSPTKTWKSDYYWSTNPSLNSCQ